MDPLFCENYMHALKCIRAGKDGTVGFDDVGHSNDARESLIKYFAGDLPVVWIIFVTRFLMVFNYLVLLIICKFIFLHTYIHTYIIISI